MKAFSNRWLQAPHQGHHSGKAEASSQKVEVLPLLLDRPETSGNTSAWYTSGIIPEFTSAICYCGAGTIALLEDKKLIAPSPQLSSYLLIWFSSIKVPLLEVKRKVSKVHWASHQKRKFTVLEDAEPLKNKSQESPTKFSSVGGSGRSIWEGGETCCSLGTGSSSQKVEVLWRQNPFRSNPYWGACELYAAGMILT